MSCIRLLRTYKSERSVVAIVLCVIIKFGMELQVFFTFSRARNVSLSFCLVISVCCCRKYRYCVLYYMCYIIIVIVK